MKAWVLYGPDDLRYEEVDEPHIGRDEVLVKIEAAGICGSDIQRVFKTGAHIHPLIPGHEFSGIVVRSGADVRTEWQGKRVGVFPLIPCMKCGSCMTKKYELCRDYSYLGSRRDGAFAEYTAVPEWNLLELPENISFEAAAMLEPMSVAVHAMRRIPYKIKQTITVFGLGTIGLLLTAFLKDAGCTELLVIGNKEYQRSQILSLGLSDEDYCDSTRQDVESWISEKTGNRGTDIFFDCVGKNEVINMGLRLMAPEGYMVMVGNPASDISIKQDDYWKILREQLTISGTWNSSFTHEDLDDWHYVLERLGSGRIHPEMLISHRLNSHELMKGLTLMRDKTEFYGKVMIGCQR